LPNKNGYEAANREKIAERRRLHYAANREKIAEKRRLYEAANREKITPRKRRAARARNAQAALALLILPTQTPPEAP
jgi:hypothetical protein